MGMIGRHKDILYLEVATAGAPQAGDVPRVEDRHILAGEIAIDRRQITAVRLFDAAESHEPRRVMGAAAERPSPGDAIPAIHADGGAHSAGG